MPYPTRSPYELLEVRPGVSPGELMRAYQQALKQRIYPAARVTQAFNDLRNPRTRAMHDLLVHEQEGDTSAARELLATLPPISFLPTDVSPLPIAPSFEDDDPTSDSRLLPSCSLQLRIPEPGSSPVSPADLPPPAPLP